MKWFVTVLAAMAVSAAVAAEGEGRQPGGENPHRRQIPSPEERFARMDTNTNGVIEKAEFKGPAEMFDRMDTDKSGTLTKEEIKATRERMIQAHADPEARFKAMDKNSNGVIDRAEFLGAGGMFDRMDTDKSGTLTKEEMAAAREKIAQTFANPEERFKMMDANTNGVIDRAEFKGPATMFDRIDADKSGTLSKDEVNAIHAKKPQPGGDHAHSHTNHPAKAPADGAGNQ